LNITGSQTVPPKRRSLVASLQEKTEDRRRKPEALTAKLHNCNTARQKKSEVVRSFFVPGPDKSCNQIGRYLLYLVLH